ncbi:3-deoxy-8-phosphooctulonate synthase [bacterium]|nr:3-deoxy-8-phosphooctulonate synthase [bacterium]
MNTNQYSNKVVLGEAVFCDGYLPAIIAGPCVIESPDHAMKMALILKEITTSMGFGFVFKASFDKANRSSIHSYRGPGIAEGLNILSEIRKNCDVPVLTDIHSIEQIGPVSQCTDIIQIPAFLCRQTDLFIEAGKYGIPVNVKKGQFMSPGNMRNVVEKARESGIHNLMITERGSSFGYERLVVDYSGVITMRELNVPIVFDGTHSVQLPGAGGDHTKGNRKHVPHLCRAAAAVGVQGLFLEVHDCPDCALCDGPNMITPDTLRSLLSDIKGICKSLKDSIYDKA